MLRVVCFGIATLLLAGCVSTATNSDLAPGAPSAAPGSAAVASPLAGIVPSDALEADLIAHPEDLRGLAAHAVLLQNQAAVAEDDEQARRLRRKARAFALAAMRGGSQDLLLGVIVNGTAEDGSLVPTVYSSNPAADAHVSEGEKKFARGDFEGALVDYQAAWQIDPCSAKIAVFIGDVYFVKKEHATAIEWFDRAIVLAPWNETAHRYRADALMRLRRIDEAGEGYLSAVIADPYHPLPRGTLRRWAAHTGRQCVQPELSFARAELAVVDGKFELRLNPDSEPLTIVYGLGRASYYQERQQVLETYRHSLAEEVHALQLVAKTAAEMRGNPDAAGELKPHAEAVALLERLIAQGMLEAHVLLDRADEGISRDYAAYRDSHSAILRRYVREFWLREDLPNDRRPPQPLASRATAPTGP